ncbi:GNAT family N-acetyltransferase [Novosphingobium sp. TCA1]|uniref:GNAT family N-acetyltransferase n=1 Tax=Novosphingobium sp. TCA1 TaxID=2682474 RepID=UPI001F1ADC80|nr:GNAT family N-acetyltransferase [Novosphingobium sp. TCA1]
MTMTEELTVCGASIEDAAGITEIYAHYVLESTATFETDPPDLAESARRIRDIADSGYPFLVVREVDEAGGEGRVLGFGYAHRYGPRVGYRYSVETTIFVAPDCIGRGIGGRLLASLLDECEARGFRQAFAVIAESEPASVVLHARAGFRPVGTLDRAGWKHGKWLDVFIMQRQLGEGDQTLPEMQS